ncbi:Na+/H+ antiporter NhaA [Phenylobacterium sp.]|uniref:Na+/H+ antiporter NhaA n=1 Tax=Phenylobacterium sp. TaxID=1871053 RepID=UPI0030F49052
MTSTRRHPSALRTLFESESAGGLMLMGVAALALLVANSPLAGAYFTVLHAPVGGLDVLHWINDGLMAVFFLLVGLEIKREVIDGELSTWSRRILPGVAAAGGMLVPALVFLAFQGGDPKTMQGWAIPAATDIAFALGILSLLGSRVPVSLKVFLTALAIIDDLGAVLIIAFFYTSDIALWALAGAAVALAALIAMNRMKVSALAPYLVVGAVLWWLTQQSGVHATLAGVALALTIPLRRTPGARDDAHSPLHILEHAIQPWVAFLVVPIFGFANAGISFAGLSFSALLAPVPLGVAAGLFLGKQIGVFGSVWLLVRLGFAERPGRSTWRQIYGVSVLCGIGFTMSLFIGLLAFKNPELQEATKLGVLAGSVLAAGFGWAILRKAPPRPKS